MSNNCVLCGAYQKFYSALSSLKDLGVNKDFFNNISSIDKFLSEFRSITFVLQKSIKKIGKEEIYIKIRDEILVGELSSWLIDKRNQVVHEESFKLSKWVLICTYIEGFRNVLCVEKFNMENDIPVNNIKDNLERLFDNVSGNNIYGSIYFNFAEDENSTTLDNKLYNKFLDGIILMSSFLEKMNEELNINCKFCKEYKTKIKTLIDEIVSMQITFVRDFEYLKNKKQLIFAEQLQLMMGDGNTSLRLKDFKQNKLLFEKDKRFKDIYLWNFIMLHLPIYKLHKSIMPTFMVLLKDNTFYFDTFTIDTKATFYRYLNELSDDIIQGNIQAVYYVGEICHYSNVTQKLIKTDSKDRQKFDHDESLIFISINENLEEYSLIFNKKNVDCNIYINKQLENTNVLQFNWGPVKSAFEKLSSND